MKIVDNSKMCVCATNMNKPDLDQVCQAIMEYLLRNGYQYQVKKDQLKAAIFYVRGMDPRTYHHWIDVMLTLGYIKVSGIKPEIRANRRLGWKHEPEVIIYEMNVAMIPHLVALLKEHPQTRIG